MNRFSFKPIFVLFFIFLLWQNSKTLQKIELHNQRENLSPPLANFPPRLINVITLGHKDLYDDLITFWLLQHLIPSSNEAPEPLDLVYSRIIRVLKLHPKIEAIYLFACYSLYFRWKKPELCQDITTLGLQAFPTSWKIPLTQGYMLAFPLNKPVEASLYYQRAASQANAPKFAASFANKLLRKEKISPSQRQESINFFFNSPDSDLNKFFRKHE